MGRIFRLTILLVVPLANVALGQTPRTAEDYNRRGLERQGKGDVEGAIDDYTKAIALKARPNTIAIAYNNRANAGTSKNDLEGAISDYSKRLKFSLTSPKTFTIAAWRAWKRARMTARLKTFRARLRYRRGAGERIG